MKLIGAGLPRTGTLTQKLALEQLGFGPAYHWVNVIADLDQQVDLWNSALDGGSPWEEVFAGHHSTVDWPGGYFYRELMEFYPEAKVLLSVRDPESWEPSFRDTIWTMSFGETLMPRLSWARAEIDPRWRAYLELVDRMFWGPQGTFAAGNAEPSWARAMTTQKAFPLRVVVHDRSGKEEYRAQAFEAKWEPVDESAFQVPAGFKKADLTSDLKVASLP